MDNFSVKNRNDSPSSGASDIDLDDIAKMIDPIDDLEENLFSIKAKQTSKKHSQVLTSDSKSLIGKDAEEMEILTSMSSNNGQQINVKYEDDIFGGLLKNQQSKKQAAMPDAKANEDELGKLKKAHLPDSKTSEDLNTGLWSGDDLWNLGRSTDKLKQTAGNTHSISPVKSHKEIGPHSFNSPERSPKSFSISNPSVRQRRRSNNPEITASGNKKPGKFDWLGLLDSSDDEKQLSLKSAGQGTSLHLANNLKEKPHEISNHKVARENDLHGNIHFNNEEIPNASEFLNRAELNLNQNILSLKNSLVEDTHKVIPQMIVETTGSNVQPEKSSLHQVKDASESFNDTTQTKMYSRKENETNLQHPVAKGKSSLMEDFSGPLKKIDGGLKLEGETLYEKSSMSKRGSISEENEASSAHTYAPTFIGDKSESSGRRRRRNENKEIVKTKETFSGTFDPLGLFLMDDKEKIEVKEVQRKPLPEWLTGAKKTPKAENQRLSPVEKKRENLHDLESTRDTVDKKLDPTKVEETASKSFSDTEEPSGKAAGAEVANFVALNDENGARNKTNGVEVVTVVKRELSLTNKESTVEDCFNQENSIEKGLKEEKADRGKLSMKDKESRGGKITKEIKPHLEELNEFGSDSDHYLDEKDLRRRRSIKKSLLKKKRRSKKENYGSESEDDHSSFNVKNSSFNLENFEEKEKYYLRKIKDLEEKAVHLEYLEDELAQMNHLKGEVEHLRAVIHMLELEKSTTESLVMSLQERHSEQLKRLEEVHRNEVNSLKEALCREEKRGAEEVGRLTEDHRKTVERLMEANVRMEEEFRNRMFEARKDWSRDMEAMRLAYQQSSNAAITNASLAVLTGHGIGAIESKDKSENSKRDSSSKSQCSEEVKGLSQTVERVETILMQTLEAVSPKVKNQKSNAVVGNLIEKGNQQKFGKIHKSVRERKRVYYKVVSPRKRRKFLHVSKGKDHNRHVTSDEHIGENLESDSSQQLCEASSDDSVIRNHPLEVKKKNIRMFSDDVCKYCNRCQHCSKKSSSLGNNQQQQKSDKEGKNKDEYIKGSLKERLQKDYGNEEKHFSQVSDNFWLNKIREKKNISPASARVTMDDIYFSTVLPPRQPGIIIDPKQYLMKLASGNRSNLFQPIDFLNV